MWPTTPVEWLPMDEGRDRASSKLRLRPEPAQTVSRGVPKSPSPTRRSSKSAVNTSRYAILESGGNRDLS